MKALVLVFMAVLISGSAMASVNLMNCVPSQKVLEETPRTNPVLSFTVSSNQTGNADRATLYRRYPNESADQNKLFVSNKLNVGADYVDGKCELKFAFVRDAMDCRAGAADELCDSLKEVSLSIDPQSRNSEGQIPGYLTYQQKDVEYLLGLYKKGVELPEYSRDLNCFVDQEYLENLCMQKLQEASAQYKESLSTGNR